MDSHEGKRGEDDVEREHLRVLKSVLGKMIKVESSEANILELKKIIDITKTFPRQIYEMFEDGKSLEVCIEEWATEFLKPIGNL
jgi:hypothetical protein